MNPPTPLDSDDAELTEPSDDQIIAAVRGGDIGDFALLWRRHVDSARRAARAISPSADPDDLVSEAFASILRVTKAGGGPSDAFRPYLLATLRNTAARWSRGSGMLSIEVISEQDLASDAGDPIERISERSSVAEVFGKLSARHRTLLWYLEVEGMKPRELAPLMGLTPNAVSALALRARDSFRRAWLQAHIRDPSRSEDCRWFCERIVAQRECPVRGDDVARFRTHMGSCRGCQLVAAEIDTVSQRLRSILPAAMLGGVAAGLYAATDAPSVAADVAPDDASALGPWFEHAGTPASEPAPTVASTAGVAAHASSSASLPMSGLAALAATTVAVIGAVVFAGSVLSLPDVGGHEDRSSNAGASGPVEDHPQADADERLARATDPTMRGTLPSPGAQHLLTVEVQPDAVEADGTSVPAEAPSADSATAVPRPTHAPTQPPTPQPTPQPTSSPRASADPPAVDSLSEEPDEFDITRSIAQDSLVPGRIEGTGSPGAIVSVVDEAGATIDAESVADDGTFVLDVSGDRLRQGMTVRVRHEDPQTGITRWAQAIGPLSFAVPAIIVGDDEQCRVPSALERDCLRLRAAPGAWVELLDQQGRSQIVRMPQGVDELILFDVGAGTPTVAARYIDPTSGRSGVSVAVPRGVG
ncbi:sigma-70 family RNA polymerase sigma factor [Microbacterium sp. WCS2018Hpa-23]|uniref:RNA polymerase sigma factor n=1 Tax=Microbacterium sp. WCS2018Hpa-23 TaxID=3073634 RepID=UPI00288324CA|nr:sigma-70 family RNA polymerase sigma factor [Microbacterium sp. WCS2018Hpa-23]